MSLSCNDSARWDSRAKAGAHCTGSSLTGISFPTLFFKLRFFSGKRACKLWYPHVPHATLSPPTNEFSSAGEDCIADIRSWQAPVYSSQVVRSANAEANVV